MDPYPGPAVVTLLDLAVAALEVPFPGLRKRDPGRKKVAVIDQFTSSQQGANQDSHFDYYKSTL